MSSQVVERAAPQKVCPKCQKKNHVRRRWCINCNHKFSFSRKKMSGKIVIPNGTVEIVVLGMRLLNAVNSLEEAISILTQIEETNVSISDLETFEPVIEEEQQ